MIMIYMNFPKIFKHKRVSAQIATPMLLFEQALPLFDSKFVFIAQIVFSAETWMVLTPQLSVGFFS